VRDLAAIFKAYDVRGRVPEDLDEDLSRRIGAAFVTEVAQPDGADAVVVGHDMRASSPGLSAAFADGARDAGADVVAIGLCATDELYFASGRAGLPAAMFTASHNPAGDNGIKLCRAGAAGISADTGLTAIRDRVCDGGRPAAGIRRGGRTHWDVLPEYADHLRTLAPIVGRSLEIVVDAGNGMAGLTVPAALADPALTVVPLYFELDGSFPNHQANPLDPTNLEDLQEAVVRQGADLGLAFDGDADRCFAVDERGTPVSPSAVTSLIAVRLLAREPGVRIIHNVITSRAVPETVRRHGGVPVRTKVGHSLIKAAMAQHDAAFGGEHSGHYYFRDFWYADSGMLAARHLLGALAESDKPLSRVVADYEPYHASGEHNLEVADTAEVLERVATEYAVDGGVEVDRLDGVTVSGPGWWFNVRASNTEPLLRLNVEGDTRATMMQIRDDVLSLVRS